MSQPLAGRTAVVTGGSRGIGAAIASSLASAGARVFVSARSEELLARVAGEIRALGGQADTVTCDVTDEAGVEAMAESVAADNGGIDILVNNAGIASSAPLHHQTLEEWRRLFEVNVVGTFLCTRALAPAMAKRGWGRVINVASVAGRTGAPYIGAYAASKHAVIGFTRSIAAEMAPRGVTVNAICPGYVDTEMTVESLERIMSKTGLSREEALGSVLQTTPQRRLIEPQEVAHVALALCGEEARGINGQAIGIDGGQFLG